MPQDSKREESSMPTDNTITKAIAFFAFNFLPWNLIYTVAFIFPNYFISYTYAILRRNKLTIVIHIITNISNLMAGLSCHAILVYFNIQS
jgi:hypothetical protein